MEARMTSAVDEVEEEIVDELDGSVEASHDCSREDEVVEEVLLGEV